MRFPDFPGVARESDQLSDACGMPVEVEHPHECFTLRGADQLGGLKLTQGMAGLGAGIPIGGRKRNAPEAR